ncbi:MAG: DUF1801 domain-containing protein [Flavobacterium sp.]|uniref:DUF1801 domain-containing protein n=1 Tax=Flavobacterium sp. TaxID=239 RepID=UPI0012257D8A|nr:DUF1801 domain-containing protein [Flavobacterium sp.]RZJ67593.1 MAG: DUF1801 domain-containing protein [Flavobacterium sp.]
MDIQTQIADYIDGQPAQKSADLQTLHAGIVELNPKAELWFLDGKNADGKIVSNPNIGYGRYTITYADGTTKDFYQIGLSANTTGISVYILGLDDKTYLSETYAGKLGKASVTGYCIKFKKLSDIDVDVLKDAIRFGLKC